MKIEFYGNSCFKLTESTGASVITDPYSKEIGYEMPKLKSDMVTISHNHFDHNNVSSIINDPKIIDTVTSFEDKGVKIVGVSSYHDDKDGADRGENIIYKYRMDGIDICHLGDIGQELDANLLEQLLPVNVLLVPVGGKYTIDAEIAYDYVTKLMPDIVIPMHYRTKNIHQDLDKVNTFIDKFDDENVHSLNDSSIEIDRSDLSSLHTNVYVLKRKSK